VRRFIIILCIWAISGGPSSSTTTELRKRAVQEDQRKSSSIDFVHFEVTNTA